MRKGQAGEHQKCGGVVLTATITETRASVKKGF